MSILGAILAGARYVVGFVLLLGAATVVNVGIVLGWDYLSPDSFSRTVSLAVGSVDPAGGPGGEPEGDAPIRRASVGESL